MSYNALMKSMPPLQEDLEYLKEQIKSLCEENKRRQEENLELRRRFGMDSTNSHQPPSSDGYRKKTTLPGLPKNQRQRTGGQRGHKERTLERVEQADYVEVPLPKPSESGGRPFGTEEEYEIVPSRQIFDLPEPKLEVTEHRLGQITGAGIKPRGKYPAPINTLVQYGAGVRALIVMLSVSRV